MNEDCGGTPRVWPRFDGGGCIDDEGVGVDCVWIDPVTGRTVTMYLDGVVGYCDSAPFRVPVAEVARKLGIVLEGVNDQVKADEPASTSPEASTAEVPLAVGQEWESNEGITAKIARIDGYLFPNLISPAPEPQPQPPSRDDLISALVAGKRLRFERDESSECRGPWREVFVRADKDSAHNYRGCVWSQGEPATSAILTEAHFDRSGAAAFAVDLAFQLGYRFASVVD